MSEERAGRSPEAEKYRAPEFSVVFDALGQYEVADGVTTESAYFEDDRPCTLLIEEIESVWDKIADSDDWSAYEAKLDAIEEMRLALVRD